jgi:hypothetical protein
MYKIQQLLTVFLQMVVSIYEIFQSVKSFEELEERVQRISQRATAELIQIAVEEIDERLANERDRKQLINIGKRKRTLVTTAGEISVERRYYKDISTGQNRLLLDETLGLATSKRVSPRLSKMMLEMGIEMPFRKAARLLEYLVPGVSAMTVWNEVKQSGERAKQEAEETTKRVFEDGVVPEGKREAKILNIEADGVLIRQQRSSKRHAEVKLFVGYERKEGNPKRLINRCSVAGVGEGIAMWEEASAKFGQEWRLNRKSKVRIGGDGAAWVKEGLELFPGASYHLDPFHLRKHLTESLSFSSQHYQKACEKILDLGDQGLEKVLNEALRIATNKNQRKRIRQLHRYLLNNWDGISQLSAEERLGTVEGQIRHTIARRMKRIGARWSPAGTDNMARLLAAKANQELSRYATHYQPIEQEKLIKVLPESLVKPNDKDSQRDYSNWLAAEIPARFGPHADHMWVKYVLREISQITAFSA